MPPQDGLRFLFDIQDKISSKLAKIESKAKSSAANIDKAFTRASKSQQTNSSKAVASEQRRIIAVEKSHAKAIAMLKRESDEFKRSMGRMAAAATVAFAAVAGKALQMAGSYDAAMRSVQAKTGATGALMDRLSEQSREMGRTTVHSATEAARGQAFLAQAGFDANEILEALPATLALATAGELDLASAADIASNVLKGFRLETAETGRVTDVLAAIAAKTNTSVSQMGVALAKAAPAAASAGWSLEQTAAAIGRLSDAGIQGEEAGTVLKTMLARLAAPTGKLEKLMTATGISVKDTTGRMLPLNDIIAQLAPHADNTGLMFELLGTRGANAGLILGSLGDDDLNNLTAELERSEGAAQTMADTMSGGLWGSIKSIQSIIESAYISLGERFAPAVDKIAKLFTKLPAPIQEVVVVVGSLAGAMGGLMILMPSAFGALTNLPKKLAQVTTATRITTLATINWNRSLTLGSGSIVAKIIPALKVLRTSLLALTVSLGPVVIAIAAVFAAWKIGQMETVKNKIAEWTLRLQGFSKAEAKAAVAGHARAVAQAAVAEASADARAETAKLAAALEAEQASAWDAAVANTGLAKGMNDEVTPATLAAAAAVELLTNTGGPFTAAFHAASQSADRFGNSLLPVIANMRVTNQLLPGVQRDFMAAATAIPAAIESADSSVVEAGKNLGQSFSESFSARLARTFESGGSFTDAFKAQLVEMGQNLQGALASKLSGVLNIVPIVGPLLAAFGPALIAGLGEAGRESLGWDQGVVRRARRHGKGRPEGSRRRS